MKASPLLLIVFLIFPMLSVSYCIGQGNIVFYDTPANAMGVTFVDASLSVSAKSAIVSDLRLCLQEWGKTSKLIIGADEPELAGYLNNSDKSPHYPENIKFPGGVMNGPNGLALQIPKVLSDAYTNAFAFAAANSNVVAAAHEFVKFVSSTNFCSVTSNQISNYFLYNQAPPLLYQLGFHSLTNSMRQQTYHLPSILGFYYSPEGPAATNLWMLVPCSSPSYGNFTDWGPLFAIWHDGKWKFSVWEDEPHYNLPQ